MSTETATDELPSASEEARGLAADLGDAVQSLETHQAFEEAKAAVETDSQAQEMIRRFEQLREEFMLARQTGDATNEDLRELQESQQTLNELPVMRRYLEAKRVLEQELEDLNRAISAPLAVDFGEQAGGCCQD
jgi:cell fate (sporulation/competence/biofilm development) regulator YlbF (YheA/YmcA/DUF963 family)